MGSMRRLTDTDGLTELQRDILRTVRDFVDAEVIPVASELEHADAYPDELVRKLRELGVFGLTIDAEHGGLGESLLTYALVVEELSRGWMSLSGILNTHFIVAYLVAAHGTQEQRDYFLPRMATGEIRSALSMSEPDLGSDVAAIRTAAARDGDDYVITGQKMWLTNGGHVEPGRPAREDRRGRRAAAPEPDRVPDREGPGLRRDRARPHRARQDPQARLPRRGHHRAAPRRLPGRPRHRVLGERPGQGFYQIMDGIEVGRVNVAARGCGVAHRAFELALAYSRQRQTFGKVIGEHQAITFKLAEMATKVTAAHQMMVMAARRKSAGGQADVEAGMAKYLAAEYCKEVVEDSLRIHGGYGYSTEHEIERLYRDAPMLLIGEGTAEIQKMVIGRALVARRISDGLDGIGLGMAR